MMSRIIQFLLLGLFFEMRPWKESDGISKWEIAGNMFCVILWWAVIILMFLWRRDQS